MSIEYYEPYKSLSDSSLKLLLESTVFRTFSQDEVLFYEGDTSESIYVVVEGEIRLVKFADDGHEIPVRLMTGGETFAEATLYHDRRFPVTAIASRESRVAVISHETAKQCMDEKPFRESLLTLFMVRMRYLADQLVLVSSCSIEERFMTYLVRRYGKHAHYELQESKKEIARNIETAPETLSRMTARLQKLDIITWEGHNLRVNWKRYLSRPEKP